MDAHERFLAHRPDKIWYELQASSQIIPTLSDLVDNFYKYVSKANKDHSARSNLEKLRNVLCTFYQAKILSKAVNKLGLQFDYMTFEDLDVDLARGNLNIHQLDAENLSLVLDILSLRMALHSSVVEIMHYWVELQELMHQQLKEDNEIKTLDIKLMDCYMDGLFLNRKISVTRSLDGQEVKTLFLKNVRLWLTVSSHQDCQILTVLLPKLLEVVNDGMQPYNLANEILSQIWYMILELHPDKVLSMLRLTYRTWFPEDFLSSSKLSLEDAIKEPLWVLLSKGLLSEKLQQRQDALFLIGQLVDFIAKFEGKNLELGNYKELKPLLCAGDGAQQDEFRKNVNDYFVIMKGLEEKQPEFVEPMLPLLQVLAKKTFDPAHRESSLHIAWIRCAFLQSLKHTNSGVVKQGLLNVFALDPELCNDEFLQTVVKSLNSPGPYRDDPNKEEPIVMKELVKFLNDAETKNTNLLARFVITVSKIMWYPFALFFVIRALSMVSKVGTTWREVELRAVKSLAKNIPTMMRGMFRLGSQIELLEAMTHFTTESLDLVTVADTLAAFPTDEALLRGKLAWNRTVAWVVKTVTKDEAITFLEKACKEITNPDSEMKLSMKSLSLMIMLFFDGQLMFNSSQCPGITALHNLLSFLISTNLRSNVNVKLKNKCIELVHNLLDLTSVGDQIICGIISRYSDEILRSTLKNLRNVSNQSLIENIDAYFLAAERFFRADGSIIAKQEITNHIEQFELESCNIIGDEEWSNDLKRFFGIKILHACLITKSKEARNYKFIGPLQKAYKIPMTRSCVDAEATDKTRCSNQYKRDKVSSKYYKFVAELFHEYVKDEPANKWLPGINWIEEALYLIRAGGSDNMYVPVFGILSQVFYKETLKAVDIENFVIATRMCCDSMYEIENRPTMKTMVDLIFSTPFLKCEKTRKLAIERAHEMDEGILDPEERVIFLNGLNQVEGKYMCHFYHALLTCLFDKTFGHGDEGIKLQAYHDVYPNYTSCIKPKNEATAKAVAVTFLHKLVTDDTSHAHRLLPLIYERIADSRTDQDNVFQDSHSQDRAMQVLLILQPVLNIEDTKSLHEHLCNELLSQSPPLSVRIMQEWLLIRIYAGNKTLHPKIWDLLKKGQELQVDSLSSVFSIVYHVARQLLFNSQSKFINSAFRHIIPYYMSDESDVRSRAQVITSMLYEMAVDDECFKVTKKYKDLYTASKKGSKQTDSVKNSGKLEGVSIFTTVHPIYDYSLQTLFYDVPKLSNASPDEYIQSQIFEKVGFKKSNIHPLTLSNSRHSANESEINSSLPNSSRSAEQVRDVSYRSENLFDEEQNKSMQKSTTASEDEFVNVSEASASP